MAFIAACARSPRLRFGRPTVCARRSVARRSAPDAPAGRAAAAAPDLRPRFGPFSAAVVHRKKRLLGVRQGRAAVKLPSNVPAQSPPGSASGDRPRPSRRRPPRRRVGAAPLLAAQPRRAAGSAAGGSAAAGSPAAAGPSAHGPRRGDPPSHGRRAAQHLSSVSPPRAAASARPSASALRLLGRGLARRDASHGGASW